MTFESCKPVAFMFDSAGGNIYGAYDVAELIREHKGMTGVEDSAMCASACVLMWGAGAKKFASTTSHIGVHGVAYDPSKAKDASKAELDKLAKDKGLFEATSTLEVAQQLNMYCAPDHVVVKALMTPSSDMYWLTADDAKAWDVEIVASAPKPLGAPTTGNQASVRPTQTSAKPTQVDPPGLY
jgi:hypothetical protein